MPKWRTTWIYLFGLVITPIVASIAFIILLSIGELARHGLDHELFPHSNALSMIIFVLYISAFSGILSFIPMIFILKNANSQQIKNRKYYIVLFSTVGFLIPIVGSMGFV